MVLKAIGIFVILAASILFGESLRRDYMERIRTLEQISKMLLLLKGEIKYNNSGMQESIMKIAGHLENTVGEFLKCVGDYFCEKKSSLQEAWDMGIDVVLKPKTGLKKEDISVIQDLGKQLGITDRETQINSILHCREALEIKMEELNKVREEKCRLYRTLGVMMGAFMAIVLI